MVLRLPVDFLVAKRAITVRKPDGSSETFERGDLMPAADAAQLRGLSGLVSGGLLIPDRDQNPHTPVESGVDRPLAARRHAAQDYIASMRRALLGG